MRVTTIGSTAMNYPWPSNWTQLSLRPKSFSFHFHNLSPTSTAVKLRRKYPLQLTSCGIAVRLPQARLGPGCRSLNSARICESYWRLAGDVLRLPDFICAVRIFHVTIDSPARTILVWLTRISYVFVTSNKYHDLRLSICDLLDGALKTGHPADSRSRDQELR